MSGAEQKVFYGWWIVAAAFLNLFFAVGIVFYGFPVFYPSLAESLGFTRAQLTQGFFHGFLFVGLPFGLLAGVLIDLTRPAGGGLPWPGPGARQSASPADRDRYRSPA